MNKVCLACEFEHRTQDEDPCAACIEFEQFVPKTPQPSKTLLDEFAMAAMKIMAVAMDQGYWTPGDDPNAEIAESSYQMAKAMMNERARRDEMGNVKEVK